ncbi:flavin reductase family protein [Hyphococcus lacteus]|uniref:Flavin reductase family protein n=1 Tax=Hyphococcus lacteus TaxID=3143536 RepID=A0ABV3Z5J9_9PROT
MTDKYRPLKDAFGRFATGIAVATCQNDDGRMTAITVNSFTSVSLEPPLVLWCLDNRASTYSAFMSSDSYGVSILRADQRTESDRFAHFAGPDITEEEIERWDTGAPILKERLAGFDCKLVARHDAGDHVILIGEVVKFDSVVGEPLVYFSSNYIPDSE